jgi:hypothetical protein
MSQAQIDASEIIDETGKPIIDPENNGGFRAARAYRR